MSDPLLHGDLVNASKRYTSMLTPGHISVEPRRQLAIVSCMDSRIDLFGLLGLEIGDAHVIRNAGGVVTDDVIRSLSISQRLLNTEAILLIHHTDCGLQKVTDDSFKDLLEEASGVRPPWAVEAFRDPFSDVRQSIGRIRNSPFIAMKDSVWGYVYDVDTHQLVPVI